MIPGGLGNETITILRATETTDTRDNSKYRDWTTATSTVVNGCMVQPFLLSNRLVIEDNLQREFSAEYFRIWMPPGTDIDPADRMLWRGRQLDVYGESGPWHDFEGVESHITLLGYERKG